MEFVPLIYFTCLTVWLWHKHKQLDICIYMSGLYVFVSLCCVLILQLDYLEEGGILFDRYDIELNIVPTILYCVLLTLGILPFSLIYKKDLKRIVVSRPFLLDCFAWFLICISFLNLYLVADSTLEILGGDLEKVRQSIYEGNETPAQLKAETMSYILRVLYYFNTATLLALPLFFYYITSTDKKWWFCALLLFASLSVPLAGIQAADRTEMMFYCMMFLYCLIFFSKLMTKKLKRRLAILFTPIIVLLVTYIVAVSIARFEEREGGTEGGALQYAGQGYLNYCFFWEHGKFEYIRAEREFPLIAHTLYKIDSNMDRRGQRSGEQGFFMSVFATYIGDLMLDITPAGMVAWVFYYFLAVMLIIKKSHRKELDISELLLIFLASAIPIFGVFYYRYSTYRHTYMIGMAIIFYIISRNKIHIK